MFLVVGLGNPGKKYENTRHNVGFVVVQMVAKQLHATKSTLGNDAEIVHANLGDHALILALPKTFMNESGRAVHAITRIENIPASSVIVVHDDVDLPIGVLRVRGGGSSGGHHGVESVMTHLGTGDFIRVRVGIGREGESGDVTKYVLEEIPVTERAKMEEAISLAAQAVESLILEGLEATMNRFNAPSRSS